MVRKIEWPMVATLAIAAFTLIALAKLELLSESVVTHALTALIAWMVKAPRLVKERESE